MPAAEKLSTTVSTKGQIVLPKAIRIKHMWGAGTRLSVEETPDGVLLKPVPLFSPSTMDEVYGCARYEGPPKSIEEMDATIMEEVKRRHVRGRY